MGSNNFRKMIGRSYLYSGQTYLIASIEHVEDDLYDIQTDKRNFRVSAHELKKDFLPVHIPARKGHSQELVQYANDKTFLDLSQVLKTNIEKLQKEPAFIPQAQAINEQAKTLIELKKLKLEIIKTVRDLQ